MRRTRGRRRPKTGRQDAPARPLGVAQGPGGGGGGPKGAPKRKGANKSGAPKRKGAKKSSYLDYLEEVTNGDLATLREKDRAYGGSWIKRGGVNAYCMLARKIDRIEQRVCVSRDEDGDPVYDSIFKCIREDVERGRPETVLEDIGDLRRYLTLIEAEWRRRRSVPRK